MIHLFLICLVSFFSCFVSAQSEWDALKKELQNRPIVLMSKTMNRKITRVHRLMRKKNKSSLSKAQSILTEITKSSSMDSEKAEAYRLLGINSLQQKEFKSAIQFLQQSIDLKTLSYRQYLDTILILAQIHLSLKESRSKLKAQKYLQKWFALADKPQPQSHALMAYVYYMQKKKKKALKEVYKAIDLANKPKKQWLGVAVNIHLELKEFQSAEKLLHRLLTLYPSSQIHWRQMSNVSFNVKNNPGTLASYQLAHKVKAFEKEGLLKQLSNLLNMQGVPYTAAKNWEQALKEKKVKETSEHYEYLGDLWSKSEEMKRAIHAYKKALLLPKAKPMVYVKLSSLYFLKQKWREGVQVLEKVLKAHSDIENKDGIYVQIGFAYYYLKEYQKSLDYFYKSEKIRGDSEIIARQWIRQVKQYL